VGASFTDRLMEAGRSARNLQRLVNREHHCPFPVPLGKRLWAWRRGFLGQSAVRYGLTDENYHDYVSDWARYIRTPRINGRFADALNNKIVFSRMLASYGCDVPEYYCLITRGRMIQIGDRYPAATPDDVVASVLAGGHFVVKPYSGGSGVSVTVLSAVDGRILMNGKETEPSAVRSLVEGIEEGTICSFVRQHEYASTIFPGSTNSIRILSMWDHDAHEPFIPFAGHRFGRPSSSPVDNCSQGGLVTAVDVGTGVLGIAYAGHAESEMRAHETHPDTGAQITGVRIPHWDRVTSELLSLARGMSYIPYVGWDVVVTEEGFTVLEGNNYPDLGHQFMFGLLEDPMTRAFYEAHDAI